MEEIIKIKEMLKKITMFMILDNIKFLMVLEMNGLKLRKNLLESILKLVNLIKVKFIIKIMNFNFVDKFRCFNF